MEVCNKCVDKLQNTGCKMYQNVLLNTLKTRSKAVFKATANCMHKKIELIVLYC